MHRRYNAMMNDVAQNLLDAGRVPPGTNMGLAAAGVLTDMGDEKHPNGTLKRGDEGVMAMGSPEMSSALSLDLSPYGMSSPHEFVAEAVAIYMLNGPGVSITADTVMRHMAKAYKRKYGKKPEHHPGAEEPALPALAAVPRHQGDRC